MSAAAEDEAVRESWAIFQLAVEGGQGLEVSVLPGSVPSRGTSKAMFLVTNRYPRKVLDLKAEAKLLEQAPRVRLGAVTFRQASLLPGEVSFGTIEIATEGAASGDHGIGLSVSYRLGPARMPAAAPPP